MKKILVLVWVVVVGFSTWAMTDELISGDGMGGVNLNTTNVLLANSTPPAKPGDGDEPPDGYEGGDGETPPDKPGGGDGGETPPDKPGDGGSEDTIILKGVLQLDGGTETYNDGTLESTNSDENVILAQTNASLTVSNYKLIKSGDTLSEDNSNFFAQNAVVAAKTASKIYIDNSTLDSNANGANGLFASGSNSTIYAYNCSITSKGNSSRGLDATYGGTVIASKLIIDTQGSHCAALATDRGNGYISATNAILATAGEGSPLVYSTGVIEVNGVTGTATRAQIAGIEGLSKIRIKNSDLSGSGEKASEPIANGVIIYQSNSGDYTEGKATFEVADSTFRSAITNGALFYITHTEADIVVQNTDFIFDTAKNYLIKVAGNDGSNGWGTASSNGAEVVFTAFDQKLSGPVSVDGISSLDMYLVNSSYTGTFVNDTTYTGNGDGIDLYIDADSIWTVTADCTLKSLTVATGAKIVDGNGNKVTIVDANETRVSGTSTPKITVTTYVEGEVTASKTITDFEIDRSAFEKMYETSQESGGGSGGVEDHNNWTNYFKPHPPENAIVKVKIDGATEYGTPDRDHKYCLDGYWDEENGVKVRLLYVTQEGYLFADGCTSNVWETTITENKQEVYPPDGVVTKKAQAKSGRSYYLTLKEAIEATKDSGKGGAKITLNDNVTLEETLTVTNSLTLDFATNVVTLGSALTQAFHFTDSVTISNGTINSTLEANVEGSTLLRFTDCKATLQDLTINGSGYETIVAHDSATLLANKYTMTCDNLILTGNGCLLAVDYANVTLTNNCVFTRDDTLTTFGEHEASIYCTSNGTVSIFGGKYIASTVLLADNYSVFFKSDNVVIAAPDGYVWENGILVEELTVKPIMPGELSDQYADAQSATNAATKINADKASYISVPTGVENSAKEVYLSKVEAKVTSDNCVVVDLTTAAVAEVQSAIDETITNETVVASLICTNVSAKVTIATTTPGLYYWIEGGTEVNAVTNAGTGVLSTNGGSIELTKPTLDTTKGKAFFRIAAGVQW